jgi:hypothetical protein
MDLMINKQELIELLEDEEGVHISLFMPLEREPDKYEMNRIRLKNLIKQGKDQLATEGFLPAELPKPEIEQLFEPAENLLSGGRLDVEQGRGLAVFLSPHAQSIYRLPISTEELILIGPRFHIKPLLPVVNGGGHYYLLSLSQKQVKLWQGDEFTLEPVDVPGLPDGMDEALALEDPERSLQFHTGTNQGGDRSAQFFGHEAEKEKKGAVLRYFRQVNEAVQKRLADEKAPLLLASVDYLLPIYQEANTYPHLLSEGVSGNPEHMNIKELRMQAWEAVQPHFEEARKAVIERYENVSGSENGSQLLDEIVPAAAYGRVDTLLIPTENGVQQWGRFDPDSGEVERGHEGDFNAEDLVNLAAVTTIENGGVVHVLDPADMPPNADLAAIFRYTV